MLGWIATHWPEIGGTVGFLGGLVGVAGFLKAQLMMRNLFTMPAPREETHPVECRDHQLRYRVEALDGRLEALERGAVARNVEECRRDLLSILDSEVA